VQRSLEAGFDVFRAMKGAQDFIALIDARERALAASLFAAGRGAGDPSMQRVLADLTTPTADHG